MRLSDVIGNSGLSGYAEVALVIFVASFGVILWTVFTKRNKARFERARYLPLEGDEQTPPQPGGDR